MSQNVVNNSCIDLHMCYKYMRFKIQGVKLMSHAYAYFYLKQCHKLYSELFQIQILGDKRMSGVPFKAGLIFKSLVFFTGT